MTIYVDADACPVKAEAERLGVPLVIVSNGGIRPSANPLIETVIVDAGADAADQWIAGRAGPGNVVVTSDIPLAARVIENGVAVINHSGGALTQANIGNVLATRDLMADLRAADPFRQGGGRAFSKSDRSRFLQALDRAAQKAMSQAR